MHSFLSLQKVLLEHRRDRLALVTFAVLAIADGDPLVAVPRLEQLLADCQKALKDPQWQRDDLARRVTSIVEQALRDTKALV